MDMTTNAARRSRRASTGRDIVNVWDCLNAIPRANTLPNKLRNSKEAERYIGNPALLETKSPVVKKKKNCLSEIDPPAWQSLWMGCREWVLVSACQFNGGERR